MNYFYRLVGLFGLVFLVSVMSFWCGRKYPDKIGYYINGINLSIGYLIWKLLGYDTYLSVWLLLYLLGTIGFIFLRELISGKNKKGDPLENYKLIYMVTIMPMALLCNFIVKGDIWTSSIIENALIEPTQYGLLLRISVVLMACVLMCLSLILRSILKITNQDEEPTSYNLYWIINIVLVIFFVLYMVPCVFLLNNYL